MSGGHFDYVDSRLKNEIFGYGDKFWNALEDVEISHLVWDVLDLLHDFDWYKSADTGPEDYKKAVRNFKRKWFKSPRVDRLYGYIDDVFNKTRSDCMAMIGEVDGTPYDDLVNQYGDFVSKTTAASILKVSRETIYNMIADGRLQTGCNGYKVFTRSIVDYVRSRGDK